MYWEVDINEDALPNRTATILSLLTKHSQSLDSVLRISTARPPNGRPLKIPRPHTVSNKSYLCLTHGQFLSSLIQPLSTSERITGVVECLHHEIRKIYVFTMSRGFYHLNPV